MCWRCSPCLIQEQAGLTCAWEGSSDTSTCKGPLYPAAALAPSIPKCSGVFSKFSAGFSCYSNFQHPNLCCLSMCTSDLVSASLGTQAHAALCTVAHLHGNSSPLSCWWTSVVNVRGFFNHMLWNLSLNFRSQLFSLLKTVVFRFCACKTLQRFVKACWYCPRTVTPWLGEWGKRNNRTDVILVLNWHKL